MRVEDIMRCLEAAQREVADEAIANPGDRSEFGYGFACGAHAGLKMAFDKVLEMHSAAERTDAEM